MKRRTLISALFVIMIAFSSCTQRLIDFTVISSKNTSMRFEAGGKGSRIEGKSMGFLYFGVSLKDAVDDAIEKAGPEFDALIDGALYQKDYPFYGGFVIEGTPVNTRKISAQMAKDEFETWCMEHDVIMLDQLEDANLY